MGNTANSTLAGGVESLNCCTAVDGVDRDDDGLEPHAAGAGHRRFQRKPDRGVCHDLTGESLFTECIDDRCGADRRPRQGLPGAGQLPAHGYGDGGREPVL